MTDDPFVTHRSLLFTVAYELLGSAADAEDTVQDTWLRWDGIGADGRAEVADPRAYLVRIVSRQALNRLRTLARRKEDYVGEWLVISFAFEDGRISRVFAVRNPDKLHRLTEETPLSR
jgi:DNA-directed RNA polymerase specialized sigma24 family protein